MPVTKLWMILLISSAIIPNSYGQSIFSALHLNEEREYKTRRPASIIEINTFYISGHKKTEKNIKTFNNAGLLVVEERFDEAGKLKEKLTYETDTISRRLLARVFERWSPRGYTKETAFYTYDKNGFLVGVQDRGQDGSLLYQTDIIPNENGHPVQLTVMDGHGNRFGKETAIYLYDRNLAVTSVFSNSGEPLTSDTIKISFKKAHEFTPEGDTYNEHGDLTHSIAKGVDGSVRHYEYKNTYDAYGNLTEQKIFKVEKTKKGKSKRIIDRIFKKEFVYE